jgi:hypothetical protein
MPTSAQQPIIIVSGLPRSGTSMMMRMLEAAGIPVLTDAIRGADADNPNGYYEFERVKQLSRDQSWLATAPGKAVKMVYRLLYDLPRGYQYQVIFMSRKMEEVLASQAVMLQRNNRDAGAIDDAQMARLFQNQLQKLDDWLPTQPHFSMLRVNYNHLLRDPRPAVLEIARFLDRSLDVEAMIAICDPALYRQRSES